MLDTCETVIAGVAILTLAIWWECICRLGCVDKAHALYAGALLLLMAWTVDGWIGVPLQMLALTVMANDAYTMWRRQQEVRRTHEPSRYTTPLTRTLCVFTNR